MGISGATLGVIISIIRMVVVWYSLSQRITGASGYQYLNIFWPPLLGSLLMAGSIYIMKLYWNLLGQSLIPAISGFVIIVLMSICSIWEHYLSYKNIILLMIYLVKLNFSTSL
jgi:hypothetical protein